MTTMSAPGGESLAIAGLLVAPVAVIGVVDEGLHTEALRELGGAILARIVDENFDIDDVGQFIHGFSRVFSAL